MLTKLLGESKQITVQHFRHRFLLLIILFILTQIAITNAQTETTRFAVIGDFGSGNSDERDVANLVKSWNPEFIVTVGDNNYPDGEAATIDANVGQFYHDFIFPYTGTYGAGAATNRFFPALGNHDLVNTVGAPGQPYYDYFTLPGNERYYDFVRGPVHFFIINSNSSEPDGITSTSAQALWLKNKLAASTAQWKIVYMHHPPYSSRTSWSNLQWAYQQWGASAVIAGHAHVYERIMKNGFPYFTNGLGGESTGSFDTVNPDSVVRFGSDYGAMLITTTSTGITYRFITRTGAAIDDFTVTSDAAAAPVAPTNLTATTFSASQINLSWTDASADETGFKIERCAGAGCSNFLEIAQTIADVNSYQDTGRDAGTTYQYRVRAFNNNGNSVYSNTAAATTTVLLPPAPPSGLTATAVSSTKINLTWTDNSTDESGFRIERCRNSGCASFTQIAQVGASVTVYSDTSAKKNSTYRYRILSFNAGGASTYSNTAEATTPK